MAKTRFNFSRLIRRYSHGTLLVQLEGKRKPDGEYIPNLDAPIELEKGTFAITPFSRDALQFGEGGTYNDDDRKLHCYTKLPKGSWVTHTTSRGNTRTYRVTSDGNYSEFDRTRGDGLYIYILERSERD